MDSVIMGLAISQEDELSCSIHTVRCGDTRFSHARNKGARIDTQLVTATLATCTFQQDADPS